VLLIGKPGVGKSGIAIGLLREACLNGFNGPFYNAQVLLDEPIFLSCPLEISFKLRTGAGFAEIRRLTQWVTGKTIHGRW
jgi:hypothetical protein